MRVSAFERRGSFIISYRSRQCYYKNRYGGESVFCSRAILAKTHNGRLVASLRALRIWLTKPGSNLQLPCGIRSPLTDCLPLCYSLFVAMAQNTGQASRFACLQGTLL